MGWADIGHAGQALPWCDLSPWAGLQHGQAGARVASTMRQAGACLGSARQATSCRAGSAGHGFRAMPLSVSAKALYQSIVSDYPDAAPMRQAILSFTLRVLLTHAAQRFARASIVGICRQCARMHRIRFYGFPALAGTLQARKLSRCPTSDFAFVPIRRPCMAIFGFSRLHDFWTATIAILRPFPGMLGRPETGAPGMRFCRPIYTVSKYADFH